MEIDFRKTKLWKVTIGKNDPDNKECIEKLRNSFESVHEKIADSLGNVRKQFPDYTAHDVSHADALWKMSDVILDDSDLTLNPLEGYILGCSFLFHDLGMCSDVYASQSLEETDFWKDSYSIFRKDLDEPAAREKANEVAIRKFHPETASVLPVKCFKKDPEFFYFIEDQSLRSSFGNIIGKIAASHGKSVEKIEDDFANQILPCPINFPKDWRINVLKLASILRIADAIHITSDRVPFSLWITHRFSDVESKKHWQFHKKLSGISVDKGRLVYQSSSPFTKNERESWWLCYDTLKMINQELLDVDALFSRHNIPSLGAYCVKNIDSPKSISRQIEVEGWTPVESQMKVTNVSGLINSLGGSALYGNNDFVPLRELVQNASDAIRAKRLMDEKGEKWGDIYIRVKDVPDGTVIEVEDNGIGMSESVLTGPFLDFGTSFWHSNLMQKEFPGLESKKFESTGHFGIGFFSVFMWGDEVTITTLGYGKGRKETLVLEFKSGTKSRPLLRPAESKEQLKDSGTKIQVHLKRKWPENMRFDDGETLISYISRLFPCMDCNLFFAENEDPSKQIISANDWIDMDSFEFLKRVCGYDDNNWRKEIREKEKYLRKMSNRVSLIKDCNGKVLGRGALDANFKGLICVGGIKAASTSLFVGVLMGTCNIANRFSARPTVSEELLKSWLEGQRYLLSRDLWWQEYDPQLDVASLLYFFDVPTGPLTVAYYCGNPINYEQLKMIIERTKENKYIVVSEVTIYLYKEKGIRYNKNVFCSNCEHRLISSSERLLDENLYSIDDEFPPENWNKQLANIVADACAEVWHKDVKDIETRSTNKNTIFEIIGTSAEGKTIKIHCQSVIERKTTKAKSNPVKKTSKKNSTKKKAKK